MVRDTRKWLVEAEADLRAAMDSLKDGHFNWRCFQCQQAAEKALKAFLYEKGYTSILTHSLKKLVKDCKRLDASFGDTEEPAHLLDMFYVPTRYPNGLAGDISPSEFYEKEDGKRCLSYATLILNTVKKSLKP